MKKVLLMMLASWFSLALQAQDARQRLPPGERAKAAVEKMAALDLTPEAKAAALTVMTTFYESGEKAMRDMRESGNVDREEMMAKRKQLADQRDVELKKIFNDAQMEKWLKEIEPSLRPQRQAGKP